MASKMWHTPFTLFYGSEWWKTFHASWADFLCFSQHFATGSSYMYFQTRVKGVCQGLPEFITPTDDTPRPLSQRELEKKSKRLAAIHDNETRWNFQDNTIPLEIIGDSQIITSWLNGTSRVYNQKYQQRVHACVELCEHLCEQYSIVPSDWGRNLIRHEYREANGRADRLTHIARLGNTYTNESFRLSPYDIAVRYPACYRAMFDGGVSAEGVGCGFWIQVGLLPLRDEYVGTADSQRLVWRDVCEACFCIDPTSTVTDAELSAVENCFHAVERVVDFHRHTYFS